MKHLIALAFAILGMHLSAVAQDDDMFNYKIIKNDGDTIYTVDTWYRYSQGFNGFFIKAIFVKVDGEDVKFTVDDTKRIEMVNVKDEKDKRVFETVPTSGDLFIRTLAFLPIEYEGRRFKLGVIRWSQRGKGSGINYYLYDPERNGGDAHFFQQSPPDGQKKAYRGQGRAYKSYLRHYPTVKKMIDEQVFDMDTLVRHPEYMVMYLDANFTEEDGK